MLTKVVRKKTVNKNCEKKFLTKVVNKNSGTNLEKNVNKSCEQNIGTKVVNKRCEHNFPT